MRKFQGRFHTGFRVLATAVYSFVVTAVTVILRVFDWTMGLRVAVEDEVEGLDLSQHGESTLSFAKIQDYREIVFL